ncbi:MAG: DMT family transporter [Eubacteriales bacterium]|nr:DMT family transporter [Eubacteriales bacterium]
MTTKERTSVFFLLLTSVIWGTAFVAQGAVSDVLGALTFNAVRNMLGALVMVPVWIIMSRVNPQQARLTDNRKGYLTTLKAGLICGAFMFLGSFFQQFGITQYTGIYGTTAVGKAGFITALYVILVPIFGLAVKKRPSIQVWIAVVIALLGLYLLCVRDGFTIDMPDVYLFICAIAYAVYILFVDHYSNQVNIYLFSVIQLLVCSLISFAGMALFEKVVWSDVLASWFPIVYAGVMSSAVAFTLEAVAQKNIDPTIASLLFCLESVFAALSGWLILNEMMSAKELIGCGLMFVAVLFAQLKLKKRR